MKLSRRTLFGTLFGTLFVAPLATASEPHTGTNEPYSMQKIRDIVDMLAAQLLHQFGEDGIRFPADYTTSSAETFFTTRAVPLSILGYNIDQVLGDYHWGKMRNYLSHEVRTKGGAEASTCKVLVYTDVDCPQALIFELRAFKMEDRRPLPVGLLYYRHVGIAL